MQNHFFNLPSKRIQITSVPEQAEEGNKVELPFMLLMLAITKDITMKNQFEIKNRFY